MNETKYIDLVLVEQNNFNFLFQAPSWSRLKKGDVVICDTCYGENPGIVVACLSVEKDGNEYSFITNMGGVTLPVKKILAKVTRAEFEYDEEASNE